MNKLSICIPTYKRLDFLKPFVESIPETYPVFISDNGNFIPDDFFQRGNVKIKHLEETVSMYKNWNSAIDSVETEWFIFPGDDDIVKVDKLSQIEEYINQYSDCAYLAYAYDIINENDEIIGGWNPNFTRRFNAVEGFSYIQRSVPFRWPSLVINTTRSRSIGNIDESFAFTAGDSLYLQIMAIKYPIAVINENVGQYRVWQNSFTSKCFFSMEWFAQIEMWQKKLESLIIEEKIEGIDPGRIHDQVIYENFMAAVGMNKQSSPKDRIRLISQIGWPHKIKLINQLRLLKRLFA